MSQVLLNQEGAFKGTRSRVAIPYDYGQSFSSTEVVSLTTLRNLFQWSDDKEKASRYASSATISSMRTGLVSANIADNNVDDLRQQMEAQEQTFRAQ